MRSAWDRAFRTIALVLIFAGEIASIIYLAVHDHFYITYLSYLTQLVRVLSIYLLIVSNFHYDWFKWQTVISIPFLLGITLFVAISVTILTFYSPELLEEDLIVDGSQMVHLGDWLLHQLPFIEAIFIVWLVFQEASASFHAVVYDGIRNCLGRYLTIMLLCSSHILFLLFYIIVFDWQTQYYLTPLDNAAIPIWLLIITAFITACLNVWIFYGTARFGKYHIWRETLFFDAGVKTVHTTPPKHHDNELHSPDVFFW